MIRVDAVWLCTVPMDMRAGTDTTLARVVQVFGSARPHRKLPRRVDSSKVETSASSRKCDEEVPIHGDPDPGDLG